MPVSMSKPSLRTRIAAASTGAVLLCSGIAAAPAFAAPATDTVSIAEIQGTGAETPLKGQTVTTEPSIVTAVYPGDPGTLGGFVIQTPGSGGKVDMSKASTGVFVSDRDVRFREMEYAIDLDAVPEALGEIRALLDRREYLVSFPSRSAPRPPTT